MKNIRKIIPIILLACAFIGTPAAVAQTPQQSEGAMQASKTQGTSAEKSNEVRARVTNIIEDAKKEGVRQMKFEAEGENGKTYSVDTSSSYTEGLRYDIEEGDTVILQMLPGRNGELVPHLSDVDRFNALIWIFVAFAVITIAVGLWRGLFSLVGLVVTVAILFLYVFPKILEGADPVTTIVLASIVILGLNMALSHGVNKETGIAYGSTIIGLVLAVIFSHIFVDFAHLSGFASEEATFLFWRTEGAIDPTGVLLASFILGAVGVLDDIAVTQGETVRELRHANPELPGKEIFRRAMNIGRHHIASTVNTLVLAYAGAAMPLFLLFLETSGVTVHQFVNTELVAEEIVRTLAGTSALVLVVPISTWLATYFTENKALTEHRH